MSKPARESGKVQIRGKLYTVIEVLGRVGDWWLIDIMSDATGKVHRARSEHWRCGCGPWKIITDAR